MSGTSLDGIDAALVDIDEMGRPTLIAQHFLPYMQTLQSQIFSLSQSAKINVVEMQLLDQKLGRLYAECVITLLENNSIPAEEVQAIGCHGQTLRHQPRPNAFSLQIGDANQIAELTRITTVADFRRRDIAAGGEGAPLVPAFHQHVFSSSNKPRQILNLGGIANITVLSKQADESFGFDLGPANALSNEWVNQHWQIEFDKNGALARSGTVQNQLLNDWLQLDYFEQVPPKSTGRELFNIKNLQALTPSMHNLAKEDVLASLIELTAVSVAQGIKRWGHTEGELLLCGGGEHNSYLVERIKHHLPQLEIGSTDALGIPGDMMEACAFAWLAYRTMQGLAGNSAKTTGALGPRILGAIYSA